MNIVTIQRPQLCSRMQIWFPKYHSETGEAEVWLSKTKVYHASPIIIIEFTKAKHLQGQRFCVKRADAQHAELGTNGRIQVFKVPFSALRPWQSSKEVAEIARTAHDH